MYEKSEFRATSDIKTRQPGSVSRDHVTVPRDLGESRLSRRAGPVQLLVARGNERTVMAADVTVTQETLTGGLTQLVDASSDLLEKAKQEAAESLESFVAGKITALFGLTAVASQFYKTLGVTKKQEAEAVWQKYYHHAAVREQVEELLEVESEWDSFLERVDRDLQTTDTQLSGGKKADSLSPDLQFTDARTGKSVTLGQYLHEGQKLLLVLLRHYG